MTSSFQAAAEKLSIATNERKQMSTKTTFKRVALVTVAALGFGLLSVAPSGAATAADTLTLSSATATQLTGETATATSATVNLTYLAQLATDSMSVTASLVSAPAGNTVFPKLLLKETATAVVYTTIGGTALTNNDTAGIAANTAVFVTPNAASVNASATFRVYMDTPAKAGTYVVKVTPAVTAGGGVLSSSAVTLTITVSTNPATDTVATSATSVLTKGDTTTSSAGTVAPTVDEVVTGSKTVSTTVPAATIKVTLKNAAAVTTTGESYTATITLTAAAGYTLTGVSANFFTVAGTSSAASRSSARAGAPRPR
jgi:hypothetical protein